MSVPDASQGDVWDCQLNPVEDHEQAGRRPCVVISVDQLGKGPSELAIVVPITRTNRTALELRIDPPAHRRGTVRDATLKDVVARVHLLTRAP